jgi:hypothetical protein
MKLLAELPANLTLTQLQALLNDRIRDVNDILTGAVSNPAEADVDMGAHRITNLADPRDDLDAVTLRTLKRFSGTSAPQVVSAGLDAYAIVFTKDGVLSVPELTPAYIVGKDRTGTIEEVGLYATVAPTQAVLQMNATVTRVATISPVLATDIIFPIGGIVPVYSTKIKFTSPLKHGDVVQPTIITGGQAQLATMVVVVRRS